MFDVANRSKAREILDRATRDRTDFEDWYANSTNGRAIARLQDEELEAMIREKIAWQAFRAGFTRGHDYAHHLDKGK